jgi:hypothetical protein
MGFWSNVADALGRAFDAIASLFSSQPVGAPAAPCAPAKTSLDLARELVEVKGSADADDGELVAQELAGFPPHVLQEMQDGGVKVVVCRGSVTDYLEELRGVRPRGWPPGSTWDNVPGLYQSGSKEVVIATVGHGTDAGAHVPKSGEGHGSHNLVLHESGHALDATRDPPRSKDADFLAARTADAGTLDAYESQPGDAGQEETYAESAARYYGGDAADKDDHPKLNEYWAGDPVGSD